MSEKNLYQTLKRSWKFYIRRIEPKDTNQGIPDCHLVNEAGLDIFVELKFLPKNFINKILPIKVSQFIWHSQYTGKNAYMLFQVAQKYYLFRSANVSKLKGKILWNDFERHAIALQFADLSSAIDFLTKQIN